MPNMNKKQSRSGQRKVQKYLICILAFNTIAFKLNVMTLMMNIQRMVDTLKLKMRQT